MLRTLFFLWSMLAANIHSRIQSDRGATAVEYGLMVALIAAVIIAIVASLGSQVEAAFTDVRNAIRDR